MNLRSTIIISLALIIISVSGGVLLWWPNFQSFLVLRKDLKTVEADIVRKEEHFVRLNELSNKLKIYSKELDKVDSALAIDPSVPALFDFMRKAASENGLAITRLNLEKIFSSQERPEVKEISFVLSATGTYPAFKNLISSISKSSRIVEIDYITFISPSQGEAFSFETRLTTFSYLSKNKDKR